MWPSLQLAALPRRALAASLALAVARAAISIDTYGAIRGNFTYAASLANGVALWRALVAASSGSHANDTRRVWIPAATNYSMLPHATHGGFSDVTLQLDGTLWAWADDRSRWPNDTSGAALNFLSFADVDRLVLTGNGTIEGEGNGWWNGVFDGEPDNRPHLLRADRCSNCIVRGWTLRNSPQYHLLFIDAINTLFEDLTVYVDSAGQAVLMRRHGAMSDGRRGIPDGVPIFPLNTDGLDIAGRNLTVRRCNITNYDDALCVKPMNGGGKYSQCSEDITIEDSVVYLGVGITIGSVPPDPAINCIRNVTFRRIQLVSPIKGIHVKPNPGDVGTGVIDQITYEDIYATDPLWWAIYVNTQQEDQPGGNDKTDCSFFFPLNGTTCPTQPRVPVTRLTLRRVHMSNALLSPGLLRCNATGPCTGWHFEDVNVTSSTNWPVGPLFMCASIVNSTTSGFVYPPLDACFNTTAGAADSAAEALPVPAASAD